MGFTGPSGYTPVEAGGEVPRSAYQALAEFRYQIRKFVRFSDIAAQNAGVEPQQHQLLLVVKGFSGANGPTISYIAERLMVRHHSAVELVDRMEKRGLVTRRLAERDHRRVIVHLTDSGEALLRDLAGHHLREIRQMGVLLVEALQEVLAGELDAGPGGGENP
jgi:DNA-binding MarR family transcriptional regulator